MAFDGDWTIFEDWLGQGGPGGRWPFFFEDKELTPEQVAIVERNAALVMDRDAFQARNDHFEEALSTIEDEKKREERREEYVIHLDHHEFEQDLNWSGLSIPCTVALDSAKVEGNVWLNDAKVEGNVWLNRAKVKGEVWLIDAKVKGDVRLNHAKVKGEVWLWGAEVEGNVWLEYLKLNPSTTMSASDMVVAGSLFVKSRFYSGVDFQRLKVGGTARFSGSTFKQLPDFRDAQFARPPEVAAMEVPPPKLARPEKSTWKHLRQKIRYSDHQGTKPYGQRKATFPRYKICIDENHKEAVGKYRKLKVMAIAANDHEMDGKFFSYEMMAKRGVETTSFMGLAANSFYNWLSGYGQNWVRPAGWMVGSYWVFFLIYGLYSSLGSELVLWQQIKFAAVFSLINIVPLVSGLGRSLPWPKGYETWLGETLKMLEGNPPGLDGLMVLSLLQQFIGIVLLFFLLLGLRNRFRLK